VEHDFGLDAVYGALYGLAIAQIDQVLSKGELKGWVEGLLWIRRQGQAMHLSTELLKPEGQPSALEAGMAGE